MLGSRSSVKPDGTWTAQEDWPGTFSTDQQVLDDTTYTYSGPRPKPKPWRCTASLAKDGTWTSGGTWTVTHFGHAAHGNVRYLTDATGRAPFLLVASPSGLTYL